MAQSGTERFSEEHQLLSEIAKAFSHPARIAILEVLSRNNSCVCGDVVNEIPLSQATVSQHLKVLKEAGLISGTIDGPKTCYCINWSRLGYAESIFREWFEITKKNQSTCC